MGGAKQYTKKFTLKMIWDIKLQIYSLVTLSVPSRYSLSPFLMLSESGPVQPSQYPSAEPVCVTPFCWINISLRIYSSILNHRPFASLICQKKYVCHCGWGTWRLSLRRGKDFRKGKFIWRKCIGIYILTIFSVKNIFRCSSRLMGLTLNKPILSLKHDKSE